MRTIDVIAREKLLDRRRARVVMRASAEQVIERTEAHRTTDWCDLRRIELLHGGAHDRESACEHGCALGFQRRQVQPAHLARLDHASAKTGETLARDAAA